MGDEIPSGRPTIDKYGALFRAIGQLQSKNEQLKAQIEKMKCCQNCAFDGHINNASYKYYSRCAYECKNYSLWEMKQ